MPKARGFRICVEDAAIASGLKQSTLTNYCSDGTLRAVKTANGWNLYKASLRGYLASHDIKAPNPELLQDPGPVSTDGAKANGAKASKKAPAKTAKAKTAKAKTGKKVTASPKVDAAAPSETVAAAPAGEENFHPAPKPEGTKRVRKGKKNVGKGVNGAPFEKQEDGLDPLRELLTF